MKNLLLKSIIFLFFITSYSLSFSQIPNYKGTPITTGCANTIATWTPSTGHEIEFKGVIYDFPNAGQSTWLYKVTNSTFSGAKAISHTCFPINLDCILPVNIGGIWAGKYSENSGVFTFYKGPGDPALVSLDPKTGVTGIKFDEGFDNQATANYFYVLSAKPDVVSTSAALKAGGDVFYGTVCGPNVTININIPITITGLNSHYETDDAPVSFTINPSSATLTGPGISGLTFDPGIAGSGTVILYIHYVDPSGCGIMNDTIQIHIDCSPKTVLITGLDSLYHMFDSIPITLTGTPVGGTFSGSGINSTNSTFTPHNAGIDEHYINYTYGEGNCTWDTTIKVIVECCVVEVLADFPSNVELEAAKPVNYTGIRIAAYPQGGRFITTSAGLTVEKTKGDSAIAWFDAYVAGPGNHIIEYEVVDDYDTCATIKEITVIEYDPFVLPVELLSFNAELIENNDVKLKWTTASETNSDYFTIERSSNAIDFEFLNNVQGSGNSNQETNYTYFDKEPLNGISYYRLSQTDFDGTTKIVGLTYIEIVNENIPLEISKWNINNSTLNVEFKSGSKETVMMNIYTSTGQLIYSKEIRNINSILNYFNTDLSSFDQGIYLLRLNNSSEKATLMFYMAK